jgi:lysyl-tRNA synthetase class I
MNNNMKKIFFLLIGFVCSIGCFAQGVEDDLYDTSEFSMLANMSAIYLAEGRNYIMSAKVFDSGDRFNKLPRLVRKVDNAIEVCYQYTQKFRKDNIVLEGYTKGEIREMKEEAEADAFNKVASVQREVKEIKNEIQRRIRNKMVMNSMFFNIY